MIRRILAGFLCAGLMVAGALAARAENSAVIVFDASNSMWGQIEGRHKIEIARDVMKDVIRDWEAGAMLGLVAYGHRRRGDCSDIETVIPVGPVDAERFLTTVDGITPRGKTPLTDAVTHAAEELGYVEEPATVILLSDGIETCDRDPCSTASDLARRGIAFTAHVIGFDVTEAADQAQLRCIAEATGGRFIPASNSDELGQALGELAEDTTQQRTQTAQKQETEPETEVTIEAPASVTAGSEFEVRWEPTLARRDYITIVPAEAAGDARGNHFRVRNKRSDTLRAPGDPGLYELRYVSDRGRTILGRQSIEVTEAEVEIQAPETAAAGSDFEVSWSDSVNRRDYVTIVPAGSADDARGNHFRVRDRRSHSLRAPSQPGLYEVRYVLDEGRRVLARATIEITGSEVGISAPATAVAGSDFQVSWTNSVHPRDYVTIVPVGAEDNERGNHFRVRDRQGHELRAPSRPGLYEVRYVLDEGKRVLARASIEITEPEIALTVPETARVETEIRVSWTGDTPHRRDYVTIVPAGAEDRARAGHSRVRDGSPVELTAPSEPGQYEIRYVLDEGKRVLARASIEVVSETAPIDAGAGLQAPSSAAPGETIQVSWTLDAAGGDHRITLARADQADFTWIDAQAAADGPPLSFTLPEKPGLYEIRYLDIGGREVLGRVRVEVQ